MKRQNDASGLVFGTPPRRPLVLRAYDRARDLNAIERECAENKGGK